MTLQKKWQTDYLAPLCSSQTLLARARLAGRIVNLFTFFNFSLQTWWREVSLQSGAYTVGFLLLPGNWESNLVWQFRIEVWYLLLPHQFHEVQTGASDNSKDSLFLSSKICLMGTNPRELCFHFFLGNNDFQPKKFYHIVKILTLISYIQLVQIKFDLSPVIT